MKNRYEIHKRSDRAFWIWDSKKFTWIGPFADHYDIPKKYL